MNFATVASDQNLLASPTHVCNSVAMLHVATMIDDGGNQMRASRDFLRFGKVIVLMCLVACVALHEDVRAQQSPRSIIPQLQEQFGLNEAQVRGALGALLVFAREKLPKVEFNRFAQRFPNAEAAMHEVKMRGVVTGPIDDRDEFQASLSNLGIAQPIAAQFAPAVLTYLDAAGYGPERDMLASILN